MPAAVESAVFANSPAWHGLGTVIDTDGKLGITVEQAIEESGLNWEVEKVDIFGPEGQKIVGRYGVQRKTDKQILGVVGRTWQPVQNTDGFQIIQDVIEQAGGDQVWIEAAGSLEGGSRVWVLAHLAAELQIAGEEYASYLLFTNGHNGRCSVTAAALDMRVVCANTLEWGLSTEAKGQDRIVRVRHTTKAAERIKEAHAILKMRNERLEQMAQFGEFMVEQKFDEAGVDKFLEQLFPVTAGQEGKPAETMAQTRRDEVKSVYMGAPNLKPIFGTRWGALQAVTEYCDHRREFKSTETQLKAQWSITGQPLKQRAADILYATV